MTNQQVHRNLRPLIYRSRYFGPTACSLVHLQSRGFASPRVRSIHLLWLHLRFRSRVVHLPRPYLPSIASSLHHPLSSLILQHCARRRPLRSTSEPTPPPSPNTTAFRSFSVLSIPSFLYTSSTQAADSPSSTCSITPTVTTCLWACRR